MTIKTLCVDIPNGYELKYSILKINETRTLFGRPAGVIDNESSESIKNRKEIKNYNKEYYLRKKAEKRFINNIIVKEIVMA